MIIHLNSLQLPETVSSDDPLKHLKEKSRKACEI